MKSISNKKLKKVSLQLAHAIVEVRSWSVILSSNLNKKKDYNLCELHDEAQKIEDFGKQLKEALALRYLWVTEARPSTPDDDVHSRDCECNECFYNREQKELRTP
jgi:hypothetical protein